MDREPAAMTERWTWWFSACAWLAMGAATITYALDASPHRSTAWLGASQLWIGGSSVADLLLTRREPGPRAARLIRGLMVINVAAAYAAIFGFLWFVASLLDG